MRRIEPTNAFKRDFRRVKASPKHRDIEVLLSEVLNLLVEDAPIPAKHRDHPLTGDWKDHRDCHLQPDLVLIYRKPNESTLQLVRMGSHSELGL